MPDTALVPLDLALDLASAADRVRLTWVLGSNGTENSLKDSGDLLGQI